MKLSRRQRRSTPQVKPDYAAILYEASKPKVDGYWRWRMRQQPLMRYRTQFSVDDVMTLIQTLDTQHESRRVFSNYKPTPLEEEGTRYRFNIESWADVSRRGGFFAKDWQKLYQTDGEVISGADYTTIEFRSSHWQSWGRRPIPLKVIGWLLIIFWMVATASLLPNFSRIPTALLESTFQTVVTDLIPWAFLCVVIFVPFSFLVLMTHIGYDPTKINSLEDAIYTLGATKIQNEKAKNKALPRPYIEN